MDLHEEYYLRNNVKKPCVRYGNGFVMLQCPFTVINEKWRFFGVSPINKEGDPGKFAIKLYSLAHNIFNKTRTIPPPQKNIKNNLMFFCKELNDESYCWWEDYEDHLANCCSQTIKRLKCKVVTDRSQIELACWEILLYCCDSYISEFSFNYQEQFHKSLDYSLKIEDRIKHMNDSILLLQSMSSMTYVMKLLQVWSLLIEFAEPKNYATWLIKLIGE